MKVSIITSVYNCESYIKEMIDSILCQTCTDWELILFDDASEDCTSDILNSIKDERIVRIKNPSNMGLTKNLNSALHIAKGEYIVRIDADDIAMPERLELQVRFMEQNPDIVLSGCWMQCFGEVNDITKTHLNDDDVRIDLLFNSAIMHPTFIVRNNVLRQYNIKYNENLKYAQDYDFTYRLSKYGRLANIPEILVKYRTHRNQIGCACREQQRACADATRKKIIKDMGVELDNKEFCVWSDFCLGKMDEYSDQEQRILEKIVEHIIKNNRRELIYDSYKLEKILSEKIGAITNSKKETVKNHMLESKKYKRLFCMMSRWIQLKQKGKSLAEWFLLNNYKNIAIYGLGNVGECLVAELKDSPIRIIYGIDQSSGIRCSLKTVITPEREFKKVDAIIITAIIYAEEIRKEFAKKVDCPFISIEDIIYNIVL